MRRNLFLKGFSAGIAVFLMASFSTVSVFAATTTPISLVESGLKLSTLFDDASTEGWVEENVPVEAVTINRSHLTLLKGVKYEFKHKVLPEDATNQDVYWRSSNTAVASIGANGVVSAKKNGRATISIFTNDGNLSAKCLLIVGIPVTKVSLNQKSETVQVGKKVQLKTTVLPTDASNRKIVWKTSNPKVALVTQAGKVSAKGAGRATITATSQSGGRYAKFTIKVLPRVAQVTINRPNIKVKPSATIRLRAKVLPENAVNKEVTWKSSKPKIASVDAKGLVSTLLPGKAIITVTTVDGKKKAKCVVEVDGSGRIFEGRNRVTSPYQSILRPNHNALDIVGMDSPIIHATVGGKIKWARAVEPNAPGWGSTWEWGYFVWIEAYDGKKHIYAHMQSQPFVSEGQTVKSGDKLGIMGNTGYSFGRHTHYEVRLPDGRTTINPAPYAGVDNCVGVFG